ncbi:hypothetical protein GCM10010168_01990 [Actinoplanes ianthinogenes]|nr:hypothetical protein GCM10010168_01990 [Actinoplanes ianthinogenes]
MRAAAPPQGGPLGSSGAAKSGGPGATPTKSGGSTSGGSATTTKTSDPDATTTKSSDSEAASAVVTSDKVTTAEKADKSDKPEASAPAAPTVAPPAKRGLLRRSASALGRGGRSVATWSRGPSGRVILPSAVVVALIAGAGTAGAYLVPRALDAPATPSATPTFGNAPLPSAGDPNALPTGALPTDPGAGGTLPAATFPATTVPAATVPATTLPGALPTTAGATGGRPADTLAAWAQTIGTKVGIPVVAVQAYGYAELVTTRTTPTCHLTWTTLAAIGKVASAHGSANGAVLGVDGVARPGIVGLPLDGQGGRPLVADSDQGTLDQDTSFDREVGPMKMTPGTWTANAVDADRNGATEINDIDDAALATASALCKDAKGSPRDLSRADSWWDAVLTLNNGALRPSAQKVFEAANEYGRDSRK